MKWDVKKITHVVFSVVLLVLIVISQIRCNRLQNQLNKIKQEQVDTLEYINKQHLKQIELYESEVSELKSEVDSLSKVKQQIIVKKEEIIVSKNTSDAVNQLKTNLEKWKD